MQNKNFKDVESTYICNLIHESAIDFYLTFVFNYVRSIKSKQVIVQQNGYRVRGLLFDSLSELLFQSVPSLSSETMNEHN